MIKKRIWELDALRGACILAMVVIHLTYDLVYLYRIIPWEYPPALSFVQNWGGVVFLLISGVCATLGSRSIRRGLTVFGCGMLVTAVTAGMYFLGFADQGIIIYFGVLHCLGVCMILWHLLRRLPTPALGVLGAALVILGLWLWTLRVSFPWLTWLGLTTPTFATADYFPLLPHLGFFLLGAVIGRTLYRNKTTLLPGADTEHPVIRFFLFLGRHSLIIYLLHQPIISLVLELTALLKP